MGGKKSLIIVNDYNIIQDGLKLLIEKENNLEVIGKTIGKKGLFTLLKTTKPDVILINLTLPEVSINSICKNLHINYPKIPLLLLLNSCIELSIPETIVNGVRGIIWKENTNIELNTAILQVANGGLYFENPENCRHNCSKAHKLSNTQNLNDSKTNLSVREIEVLKLFAEGMTYKKIGNFLNISPRTVETHKENILSKLNLNSKAEMIRFAVEYDYCLEY